MSITGGDWRVAGTTQSRYIDARQPNGMVQEVAWCGQCEYGDNTDNARLLCAAPDLLESLERLFNLLENPEFAEGLVLGSARAKAFAAINKARGSK